MATIRKHGNKWQVQVRRAGSPPVSRSFTLKADAELWARQTEIQADKRAIPVDPRVLDRTTVLELMQRYQGTVIPQKRCAKVEADMMTAMMRCSWSRLPLSAVSAATFNAYRDERLKTVKASTVCREFAILQHMFNVAIKEWSIPLPTNPFVHVRRPRITGARERRVEGPDEMSRLLAAAEKCNNPYVYPIILFAIETGMRRSEILRVRWPDFDAKKRLLRIPVAKNVRNRIKAFDIGALKVDEQLKILEQGAISVSTAEAIAEDIRSEMFEIKKVTEASVLAPGDRASLIERYTELEQRVAQAEGRSSEDAGALGMLPEKEREIVQRMVSLIYECSANRVAAKSLVDRILTRMWGSST